MSSSVYCVQPFWKRDGRFIGGSTYRFTCPHIAGRRAERLAIKNSGVLVYAYDEDAYSGAPGVPRLVQKLGDLPAFNFTPSSAPLAA